MIDRELTEAAAKAIGIVDGRWNEEWEVLEHSVRMTPRGEICAFFDPLRSKSDAMDLSLKLHISLRYLHDSVFAYVFLPIPGSTGRLWKSATEPLSPDEEAATLRAITRCAAMVWESGQKKEQGA